MYKSNNFKLFNKVNFINKLKNLIDNLKEFND